jgi:hypothetical protein
VVEARERASKRGVGRRPREIVEFAVVNVQQLAAAARDLESCRLQQERPQANDGRIPTVGGQSVQPVARVVVERRPPVGRWRRRRREQRRRERRLAERESPGAPRRHAPAVH